MTTRSPLAPVPLPPDALARMMDHNPWAPTAGHRDGLINWRHYAAAALRDVKIEHLADPFCDVIEQLEQLTTKRLIEQVEDNPPSESAFGIGEWHEVWHEHFVSWQDPVRDLVDALALTPDAKDFTGRLQMVDGEVFLDFVLEVLLDWSARQAMFRRAGQQQHPASERFPLTLAPFGKERSLLRLYRALFERFAEQASFPVDPAPEQIFLFNVFSCLFPPRPAWVRETSNGGQS